MCALKPYKNLIMFNLAYGLMHLAILITFLHKDLISPL